MQTIDTRTLLCPAPLVKTKKALLAAPQGEDFLILCDNDMAFINLQNYLKELGLTVKAEQKGSLHELRFTNNTSNSLQSINEENFCTPTKVDALTDKTKSWVSPDLSRTAALSPYVIVINSLTMGNGNAELGSLLMKAYVNTLEVIDNLPSCILFYNEGVHWTSRTSEVLVALQALEARGVEILSCGTCLDFYNIKTELAVGGVSNMYKIAEILSQTLYVVYP